MAGPQAEEPIRVGIRKLRSDLSALLRQARGGATFLVMCRDEVVARIGPPPESERPSRVPGRLAGRIRVADDFDELPAELLDAVEGERD